MKSKYCLDSYAWAEFFDGTEKGKRVKELIDNEDIITSIITMAEFSDKCVRESRDIEPFVRFIQAKAVIIPLNLEIAIKAGKLKSELRKISRNISLADVIHIQTAKSSNSIFVTGDPDFRDINDILFLD